MANMKKSNVKSVLNKGVMIELGDTEYVLKYDLNAFAEIEDSHGSINDVLQKMERGSAKAIRALIWAGLLSNEEYPTEKEVGQLISLSDMTTLSTKIQEAIIASMPEGKEEGKN